MVETFGCSVRLQEGLRAVHAAIAGRNAAMLRMLLNMRLPNLARKPNLELRTVRTAGGCDVDPGSFRALDVCLTSS